MRLESLFSKTRRCWKPRRDVWSPKSSSGHRHGATNSSREHVEGLKIEFGGEDRHLLEAFQNDYIYIYTVYIYIYIYTS